MRALGIDVGVRKRFDLVLLDADREPVERRRRVEPADLDELIRWSDAVVVLTAHAVVDWARLYDTAELVVDTVNSSAGRPVGDRQVLRLGAGWSSAAGS